jgi:hypothetical protein
MKSAYKVEKTKEIRIFYGVIKLFKNLPPCNVFGVKLSWSSSVMGFFIRQHFYTRPLKKIGQTGPLCV